PVDDFTFIPHEEVELDDEKLQTDNNADEAPRGEPKNISDIPQAQNGVVGNIGINGGASGAWGLNGRGGRKEGARKRLGPKGMSPITCRCINRALEWLARHQEPDGHWEGEKFEGKNTDVGITGLAALAFLSDGHSELHGKYRSNIFRAVSWLIKEQRGDGSIGHGYEGGLGYHHAIAGIALAEAFGMGKLQRTGVAAQKAVNYSVQQHQNRYSGWRYKAQTDADMSVTGWFVMQLKSAKVAKLTVDGAAFQGAIAFLDKCTHGDGKYQGLVSYKPERGPTPTMTAVGAVSRLFMNWKPNDPLIVGATQNLVEHLPSWEGGDVNFYYWYYGTLAMFQVGGESWKTWNVEMRDTLEERQRRGAPAVDGSWDPVGQWCGRGGRVYSTAMGALCLEVYYRYLPMYR
ncbi:MAG: prenyltransferase/squalene oxidase repeat-containing protein, partial [Planctomycetota bacterium]